MNWPKDLKNKIRFNQPLSKHTSFKIGGKARYWLQPEDVFELKAAINFAKKRKIPIFILGAGSNLLVKDRGFKGLVVKLNQPYFCNIKIKDSRLITGVGAELSRLIKLTKDNSLTGLEFLAGIPGTLGGALLMNAGAFGSSIGDLINQVTVMDFNGKIYILHKRDIDFGYRHSNLTRFIILGAVLNLKKGNRTESLKKIKANLEQRKKTQDSSLPSAGCVFKNPKKLSAGWLIEACGLKGKTIGGATVSRRHANFIINIDKAKAGDVLRLMRLIQNRVKNRFGVKLEPEIKILG